MKHTIRIHSTHFKNIIIITLCIIFAFLFLYTNIADARESSVYDKSFITIEIQSGDTLDSIAATYSRPEQKIQEYIEEVQSINNLKNTTIHSGCYIVIPVYHKVG